MGDERPQGSEVPAGTSRTEKLSWSAGVAALVLIAVYLIVVLVAWFDVEVDAESWARRISLLGGLEALAFAGAGAILGTTVQRQATKKAEEQVVDAKEVADRERGRAEANQKDAEKGRALDALARTKVARAGGRGQAGSFAAGGTRDLRSTGPETAAPDLEELVALADRY